MKTILIKGAYGESNFGDDVLMCVLDDYFNRKFPHFEVYFLSKKADSYMKRLLIHGSSITLENARLLNIDLIVYGGGTQFFSFKKDRGFVRRKIDNLVYIFKYEKTELFNILWRKRLGQKNATLTANRSAAIGIGIGPFLPGSKCATEVSNVLKDFDFLAVRDSVSVEYCNAWSIDSVILGADICFSDYFRGRFAPSLKTSVDSRVKKKVGIVVRDWTQDNGGAGFYDPLMRTVIDLGDSFDFTYFIFAKDRDKKWLKLLEGADVVLWEPDENSVFDFLSELDDFDGIITSRYHGAVFSVLLNKPTICIEIEPKLKILTDQIPELLLWENPFDEVILGKYIKSFLDDNVDFSCSIGVLNERANLMFDDFKRYIDEC